jgi:hypothetical protein
VSATLQWKGLTELFEALRSLPEELVGEATHIVEAAANGAAAAVRAGYASHRHSGNLEAHVVVKAIDMGRFGTGLVVRSTAKHAHLFESGTEATRYYTGTDRRGRKFTKASRGRMPAGHVFIPAMIRARQAMYRDLIDLVERSGATVSGDLHGVAA